MKTTVRIVSIATILALLLGVLGAGAVFAQARTAPWTVSVTYQNVGTGPATVIFDFYPEVNGTPISINPLGTGATLAAGAAASLFVGGVNELPAGFKGSAVVSSDQPLVATVVQFSQAPGFKARLLSNGFQSADASNQYLIPTVLENKFSETTVFSIQNTESQDIKATVKLYDADNAGALAATKDWVIPAGSAKYIEMDNSALTGLSATTFNGSAIVTAVMNSDGTTPAKVVAAASELFTNRNVGANFEGVPLTGAANTLYMATALCNKFGTDTNYAIQNSSLTDSAQVTVTYYNPDGSQAGTDGPYTIGHGQKASASTCKVFSAVPGGFTGSASITSQGASIVAIGKAGTSKAAPTSATTNVYTAFLGQPAGTSKVALPYIRWAPDADYNSASNTGGSQRANIAIQNLESSAIKVNVKYYGKDGGSAIASQSLTIPGKSKGNSNASDAGALGEAGMKAGSFGYYTDGKFGGAVVVEADSSNSTAKFIAISRVGIPGYAEDYNAVAVP